MLEITKTTQFRGNSKVNSNLVKVFDASVNTADPENIAMTNYIVNYELYKENRAVITADQTAFEDAVYSFQEALIAEQAAE